MADLSAFRAALGSLVAILLAGCSGQAPDSAGATIRVDAVSAAAAAALVRQSEAAGLTSLDATGAVTPGLAQSWRISSDGRSIVFRLRKAAFSDGADIHAADVVRGIDAVRKARQPSAEKDLLTGVTEVDAPLDDTVELRLSTPQPELLALLAAPALAARPARGDATAGPYRHHTDPATGQEHGQEHGQERLLRNGDSWRAASLAIGTARISIQPPEAAVRRLTAGETDLVIGGSADGFAEARLAGSRASLIVDRRRSAWLLLVNRQRPALATSEVRLALAMAIDRQRLIRSTFGTLAALPVHALSPAAIAGYAPPEPPWAEWPFAKRQAEAAQGLRDALGGPATLDVAISNDPFETRLVTALAPDLQAIGVTLRLVVRSAGGLQAAIARGDYDLALVRRDSPTESPVPFLADNLCGRRRGGPCLPDADQLYKASWQAETQGERMQMLAAAERLWAEDGAAIGLIQPIGWTLVSTALDGIRPNASGRHDLAAIQPLDDRLEIR